ncbi:MAG: hypothetical protein ACI80V_002737 [Rhodothermales bacterium]|jgi:hypothetical protein
MRSLKIVFVCGAVMVLGTPEASSQAWPQARGAGYYQVGFQVVRATEFYEPGGNILDIPTLSDYLFSFYGERGITDRLTVQAYIPLVERITLNKVVGEETGFEFFEGDAVTGLADADIGLRYGFWSKGSAVASAILRFGIPLGQDSQENGLQTGDGELNQYLGLAYGYSFWPRPAYFIVDAGFNNRVNDYSDELLYKVEAGHGIGSSFTIIGRVRGVASFRNGVDERLGGTGGLYGNNQRYTAFGAELAYSPSGVYGISIRGEGAAFAENILAAPAFGVSLFMKR